MGSCCAQAQSVMPAKGCMLGAMRSLHACSLKVDLNHLALKLAQPTVPSPGGMRQGPCRACLELDFGKVPNHIHCMLWPSSADACCQAVWDVMASASRHAHLELTVTTPGIPPDMNAAPASMQHSCAHGSCMQVYSWARQVLSLAAGGPMLSAHAMHAAVWHGTRSPLTGASLQVEQAGWVSASRHAPQLMMQLLRGRCTAGRGRC